MLEGESVAYILVMRRCCELKKRLDSKMADASGYLRNLGDLTCVEVKDV